MNAEALYDRSPSVSDAENWLALSAGALLLLAGASRRSAIGACLAVSSAPLLYRGVTGHWPNVIITHRIGLEEAPAMYRTFRDKDDSCIKVVITPGAAAHTDKTTTAYA